MFAGAVGPIFAGLVFDATGSYRISFLVTGLLTFCAVIAMFFARPAKPPEELDAQPA
jgi:cyanate permease